MARKAGKREEDKYDFLVKVVIIGDSAVGKTNILLRFVNEEYKMTHITTIGVDFKIKTLNADGTRIKMQIWDTAGQERFKTITETYYKGSAGIVLVLVVIFRCTRSLTARHSTISRTGLNRSTSIAPKTSAKSLWGTRSIVHLRIGRCRRKRERSWQLGMD